jgi:hypothetical protein
MSDARDKNGKDAEERFTEIRAFFLAQVKESGQSRAELYWRPRLGDAREPTEEEIVRRWAGRLDIPTSWICLGIQTAFETAAKLNAVVTSFRYCVPHITNAANAGVAEQKRRARLRAGEIR